jgi:hypothetical protein
MIVMEAIQVSRVNDAQGLSAWRDQWQALFKTDNHQDLSCSYAWLANDFLYLGEGRKRTCYIAHNGGKFLGAMTAESNKMRLGGRIPFPVVQVGSHFVNDYIARPDSFAEVTESLIAAVINDYSSHAFVNFERLTPWCYASFAKWAEDSLYKIVSRENDFSNVYNACLDSFDDYFMGLGKSTRKN